MGRPCSRLAASIASLVFFAAGSSCLKVEKPAPGEVIVVMSTDMPEGIETVRYTVSIGDPAMDAGGGPWLGTLEAGSLPATLGITSGLETTGPVLVHVEARGTAGEPLVHRDATLTAMPTNGVKMLSMPLDWLCSSDALAASQTCPPGDTCSAGGCARSDFDGPSLPDYVPSESVSCPGALDYCFASAALAQPTLDPMGHCTLGTPAIAPSQMNVALVLDVGSSYGACGPVGCLIPLDQDPSEGWQSSPGSGMTGAIGLPRAVCDDVDGGKVYAVATTTACAANGPLCPPPGCVARRPIRHFTPTDPGCPDGLRYACAGLATPLTDSRLLGCQPPAFTRGGQDFCCTVVPGGQTLIDDMSSFPRQIAFSQPGTAAGHWFTRLPDGSSPTSPAFVDTPGAACISSNGSGHPSLEELDLIEPPGGGTPVAFDASQYAGISFWAFSPYAEQRFRVGFRAGGLSQDAEVESTMLTCNTTPCDTLHDRWVRYDATWPPSFDPTHLSGAYFAADSPAFDFCVSQIYFYSTP